MVVGAFVDGDDACVPAELFTGQEDSLLSGSVRLPLASCLTADGALHVAVAADRLIAWATAMKLRALARAEEAITEELNTEELSRRRGSQPVRFGGNEAHALAVSEVATACAVSEHAAARALHDAADLDGPRWEVLEALEDGEISPEHARVILDQARTVPDDHAEIFTRRALHATRTRHGRMRTPAELRTVLRRMRERLHPETIQARTTAARRERSVWFTPEPDGMCTLGAYLPAEAGLAIYNGLDHDARTAKAQAAETSAAGALATEAGITEGDSANTQPSGTLAEPRTLAEHRTLAELRADALIQRLLGIPGLGNPGEPGTAPFQPTVVLTIPIGLAVGAASAAGTTAAEGTVAEGTAVRGSAAESSAVETTTAAGGSAAGGTAAGDGSPAAESTTVTGGTAAAGTAAEGTAAAGTATDLSSGAGGTAAETTPATGDGSSAAESTTATGDGSSAAESTTAAGGTAAGDTATDLTAVAELEGYGPIDGHTACRLAALAPSWHRLFTDPVTGEALGVGRTAYRPPQALRRYLNHRDKTCRFPGCTRRASTCEPDHTIEWQDGGTTDPGNLALLCRRHHALKSIGAWSYRHTSPTGHLNWTSPLGRKHTTEPATPGTPMHPHVPLLEDLGPRAPEPRPSIHALVPDIPPF
ncbi:HNH endonuclease signature motif containing protein [Arthrobacter sp. M4]|uniref:HNH endonuclease signature motif containing protein n=1 Tax=Arthrobacter sp. M4 TaxID=218160 RepID=UPI001CDC3D12|nr:HNH endonuclease signature motif containing protein [Arthrobacter sp. M4]MCA4133650.1 HNH endonuclease [Arthrobacter sp. M4]